MLHIHSEYPEKRCKRKMSQGAIVVIVGIVIGFFTGTANAGSGAVTAQAMLNFVSIIAYTGALIGAIVLLRGIFQWISLISR
ncbi:MAG: hypothetical protein GF372_09035 [Candidatus Marinimicrobia bacterium]|nr:hypothetical protein [Candidatus Neomarinimicrobiota bacterium]